MAQVLTNPIMSLYCNSSRNYSDSREGHGPIAYHTCIHKKKQEGSMAKVLGFVWKENCVCAQVCHEFQKGASPFGKVPSLIVIASCLDNFCKPMSVPYMFPLCTGIFPGGSYNMSGLILLVSFFAGEYPQNCNIEMTHHLVKSPHHGTKWIQSFW